MSKGMWKLPSSGVSATPTDTMNKMRHTAMQTPQSNTDRRMSHIKELSEFVHTLPGKKIRSLFGFKKANT